MRGKTKKSFTWLKILFYLPSQKKSEKCSWADNKQDTGKKRGKKKEKILIYLPLFPLKPETKNWGGGRGEQTMYKFELKIKTNRKCYWFLIYLLSILKIQLHLRYYGYVYTMGTLLTCLCLCNTSVLLFVAVFTCFSFCLFPFSLFLPLSLCFMFLPTCMSTV